MKEKKIIVCKRMDKFKSAAKKAGMKMTPQRLAVFREIASRTDHPTAESVFRSLRKRMPTVSLDTVYRTLWKLSDLELIAKLGPPHESVRFDANLDRHHHYLCMDCGRIFDFDGRDTDTTYVTEHAKDLGSIIASHVEVQGICRKCAKRETKKS